MDWGSIASIGVSILGSYYGNKAGSSSSSAARKASKSALESGRYNVELDEMNAQLALAEGEAAMEVGYANAAALRKQANSTLEIAEMNAQAYEAEGAYQLWRSQFEEKQFWRDFTRVIGTQTVMYGMAGLQATGTVITTAADSAREAAIDAFLIRDEGRTIAQRMQMQADIARAEGQMQAESLEDQAAIAELTGEMGMEVAGMQSDIFAQQGKIDWLNAKTASRTYDAESGISKWKTWSDTLGTLGKIYNTGQSTGLWSSLGTILG